MKIFLFAGLVLALFSFNTYAQDVVSGSQSVAQSGASASSSPHQAQQASAAATYAPTINQAPTPSRTTAIVRNTPDMVAGAYAPSMAPDSCMVTAQVGVAVAGVGASAGKGMPDETCRVLRAAEKHLQIANGAHVLGRDDVAMYQLEQAEVDGCVADGFQRADCQHVAHDSIYPSKH